MKIFSSIIFGIFLSCFSCYRLDAKTIIIGNHSSSSAHFSGMHGKYKYSSAEFVLYAQEIKDTGNIRSIGFYKCSDMASDVDSVHIYIKESDTAISDEVSLEGYTEVFSGLLPGNVAKGWIKLALAAPFAYSGNKNLVMLVVRKNGSVITKGYPDFAVSFSHTKAYQAAYFLSDKDPWKGSPAKSAQNYYTQYRPYIQLDID